MATIDLATFLKLTIPTTSVPEILRYQNYSPAPMVFQGQTWEPAGFEIRDLPEGDLALATDDVKIAIANTPVARDLIRQYNGLKKTAVDCLFVQPSAASVPPFSLKSLILNHAVEGAAILFTLKSPTSALAGKVSTKFISSADFPFLPYFKPQL